MEQGGAHEIGVHKAAEYFGLTFNIETLYMTWISMAIVIVFAFVATRRLKMVPGGWQNFLELIVTALLDQIESAMGPKGKKMAPLLITLFLFLLVSNWLGLVPGFTSPTSDLNTTLGLALLVIALVHITSIVNKGPGAYIKHYFQPYIPFVVINLIEEAAKPITLSFRLMGNIFAGEVLIVILGKLVPMWIPIPNIVWLAFSVFVGVVQAFIFTMLSMSYLAGSMSDDH
ncbi:MAG: atpB [Firmicutes bacterium]|nr:atpB [Bacillota bacterium]